MRQSVVDVNDLSRSFGGKSALDGVSFGATAGQIDGLVGANGAGKTTLIRHLLGLLQRPDRLGARLRPRPGPRSCRGC